MTADNRGPVLSMIFDSEGGFVNHPADPGGATNKGCTLKVLEAWRGRPCSVDELKALTTKEATEIFSAQYLDKVWFDRLPRGLDYAVADTSVHSGSSRAVKLLQTVLGFADEQIDGVMGAITAAAVDARNDIRSLIQAYCNARLAFMKSLKNWSTFGKGWASRVRSVVQHALVMVDGGDVAQVMMFADMGQAKATGAVKITATRSGTVALASVGTTLAAAGTAAAQASGALSAFSDIGVVRYVLLGLAVVTALGTLGVAMQRSEAGATA